MIPYPSGMKKIIVDIDNTLWNFAPVFFDALSKQDPEIPIDALRRGETRLKGQISRERIYEMLREIHMRQDDFEPYPEARRFLASLKEAGFHIIIASHRDEETRDATARWLRKWQFPYDELHLSNDKSILFPDSWAVIDDSVWTLDKAAEAGIIRTGLLNAWNANRGHPLFPGLMEVLQYLKEQCRCGGGARAERL